MDKRTVDEMLKNYDKEAILKMDFIQYWLKCVHCGWEKQVEKDYRIDCVCPNCHSPKLVIENNSEDKKAPNCGNKKVCDNYGNENCKIGKPAKPESPKSRGKEGAEGLKKLSSLIGEFSDSCELAQKTGDCQAKQGGLRFIKICEHCSYLKILDGLLESFYYTQICGELEGKFRTKLTHYENTIFKEILEEIKEKGK